MRYPLTSFTSAASTGSASDPGSEGDDVTDAFEAKLNADLDVVLAAHPAIKTVTRTTAGAATCWGFSMGYSE